MSVFLVCFVFCLLLFRRSSIILVSGEIIFVKFREIVFGSQKYGSRRFYCILTHTEIVNRLRGGNFIQNTNKQLEEYL